MECFIFCSFHYFKILLLLVSFSCESVSPQLCELTLCVLHDKLYNTLPQISHTTPYLARKKIHLHYTYLLSAGKYRISLPSSSKSTLKPWFSWDWCASWVHQYLYKVTHNIYRIVNFDQCKISGRVDTFKTVGILFWEI